MAAEKAIMTVTSMAALQIKALLKQRHKPSIGIKISIKTKGCNGKAYHLAYVDELEPQDEVLKIDDITIFIDPKAVLFLIGTEMDFVDETISSGFVFRNPNAKGTCGCGESFNT